VETRLTYLRTDDKVSIQPVGKDPDASMSIEKILNLNTPFLERRRSEAIVGLIFKDLEMLEPISIEEANQILAAFQQQESNRDEHLPEFFSVKLHFFRLFSV
jgi:hypothetical protein